MKLATCYSLALALGVIAAGAITCSTGCGADADADGIIDDGTADEESPELDLGSAKEALHMQCGSVSNASHTYGVDVSFNDWTNRPCNIMSPSAICAYPAVTTAGPNPSSYDTDFLPFFVELGNSWFTGQRNGMQQAGQAAAAYFTSELGGACTNHTGLENVPYGFALTVGSLEDHVTLERGSIPGTLSNNFNWIETQDVLHIACTRAFDLAEPYPMLRATRCAHWSATFDYDKLIAWAVGGGQGAAGVQRALQNAIAKTFAIGIGLGWEPLGTHTNGREIRRDVVQSGWDNDGKSRVCVSSNTEVSNVLTCN